MRTMPPQASYYQNDPEMLIAASWRNQLMLWAFAPLVIQQQL
jgi:hypothetical protein